MLPLPAGSASLLFLGEENLQLFFLVWTDVLHSPGWILLPIHGHGLGSVRIMLECKRKSLLTSESMEKEDD